MTGSIDPLLGGPSRAAAAPTTTPPAAGAAGGSRTDLPRGRAPTASTPAAGTAGATAGVTAGPASGVTTGVAIDLGDVLGRERPRLIRLAAVITLDHVLAEEVVQEAFTLVQRRAASTSDPAGELLRSVIQVALDALAQHRRGRLRRMVRIRGGREFVAARRPVPVEPVGLTPELAAAWSAVVGLPPRRRAIAGLRWTMGVAEDELADAVVWPSAMVAAASSVTTRRLRRALDLPVDDLERRMRAMFDAVTPHLAQEEPVTTPRGGIRRAAPAPWSATTAAPAGARVRVWSSIERRPSRARAFAVTGAIATLAVAAVAWYSLATGGDDAPSVSAPVDEEHAPAWYLAIAPLLPPGFDHVALVGVDSTAITYLAIDLARGTSLEISIGRRGASAVEGAEVQVRCGLYGRIDPDADLGPCTYGQPVAPAADGTADPAADGTAGTAAGTGAGVTPVTVVQPLDPDALAATISAGFDLSAVQSDLGADIRDTFGSPSRMRTAMSRIDTVVARTMTAQVEVGRTSSYDGVVDVLEYARTVGRDPVTTVTALHGVYPPASDRDGGVLSESDGAIAGWILGADGRAFRLTTVPSSRSDLAALEAMLVDLTDLAATEESTSSSGSAAATTATGG